MSIEIDVQFATRSRARPTADELRCWAHRAVSRFHTEAELTVRLVDRAESQTLNEAYRGVLGKRGPTNVLTFACELSENLPAALASELRAYLGDVVICAPVVTEEAAEQGKPRNHHWAHLVIHGSLHLLGFDHESDEEALTMETREREILAEFGVPDPYLDRSHAARR